MLSERVQAYKDNHVAKHFKSEGYVKGVYLSIERSRYFTESWKQTEGEPLSIRKAKALANHLEKCTLFIRPYELIVGYPAEDAKALITGIETMAHKSIEAYIEGGYVKKEEIPEWKEYLEYWKGKNVEATVRHHVTEEEMKLASAANTYMEVLPGEYTSRTQPDHDLYLDYGVAGIIKMLEGKLENLVKERDDTPGGPEIIEIEKKVTDVKAMLIAAKAVIGWANRYSALAAKMAEAEKNPVRKQQLKQIAENCATVPANPAKTYWQALQSHWLLFVAYHCIELPCHGTSMRLDQVFWPWYEKDAKEKRISRENAIELMEELLIHVDEMGRPLPVHRRKSLQGANYLATYTIGGVKPEDGTDACNDLTMVILDAIDGLRLNHPDFKFRWHPAVDPTVYSRVLELVRAGLGQPSIKNDPVVIDGLVNHFGFTLEEARSWAVVGCISPAPTKYWGRARRDAWGTAPLKFLELALNNGVETVAPQNLLGQQVSPATGDARTFKTFEETFEAFRKQFAFCMKVSARVKSIAEYYNNELCKRPLASCFFHRSLENCRDIMDVQEKTTPWANDPSIVDTVDSLVSLKKMVFDDKKYTMDEVLKALKADWKGYEVMRQEFINAPKFGNNDPYADEIATRTYAMVADEMSKVKDLSGVSPMPSGLVVTRMFLLADKIGAMPNGRKFGDPLADGGISPHAKYDRNGPMAAVLSASKIDARKQKANIFNQKLTPSSIEGEAGMKKFKDYVTTTMNLGLDMAQFNVVDAKILKEAQKKPEEHANLVVRVSGYNANFVELDRFVQDAIIERTQHNLA